MKCFDFLNSCPYEKINLSGRMPDRSFLEGIIVTNIILLTSEIPLLLVSGNKLYKKKFGL
jgi:hypothetical protein